MEKRQKNNHTVIISISIPKSILTRVDSKKGKIPRSAYISTIVEKYLKEGGKLQWPFHIFHIIEKSRPT